MELSVEYLVSNTRQVCAKQKKDIDLDSLTELDSTASIHAHSEASYYSSVLSRFAVRMHDNDDECVALLIYGLISSSEEAKILEIEQKYMKRKNRDDNTKQGPAEAVSDVPAAFPMWQVPWPRGRGAQSCRGLRYMGKEPFPTAGRCWVCSQPGHSLACAHLNPVADMGSPPLPTPTHLPPTQCPPPQPLLDNNADARPHGVFYSPRTQ